MAAAPFCKKQHDPRKKLIDSIGGGYGCGYRCGSHRSMDAGLAGLRMTRQAGRKGRIAMRKHFWLHVAAAALLGLASLEASAQSKPELIPMQGRAKAALYRPDSGPAPHVGILVMHRTSNYLTHRACTELSRRGFLMLCMNTRYENNEALVEFEKLPLDVKAGVEILRRQAGITKV